MAAELLLVNPRRKRRSRRRAKTTVVSANPRRRRRGGVRRRMSALQRKYFGGGRRRRASRAIAVSSNPRRRRSRRRSYSIRVRRNPRSGLSTSSMTGMLMPAGLGAIGGMALEYVVGNFVPAQYQTGAIGAIVQLGGAALLGYVVGSVTDTRTGQLVGAGAMTITIYSLVQQYMSGTTGSQTGQQGQQGQQSQQMGRLMGMGRMKGRYRRMGFVNPGRVLQRNGVSGMGRFMVAR